MIEGVIIKNLKKIPDERGMIMHFIKSTDEIFKSFGEVYFATAYPGVVKAWHLHKKQEQNYCVIQGMIKLVLYDGRKNSKTKGNLQEIFIGDLNYSLVTIPIGIIMGYKCIGNKTSILANCSTIPHDPNEMISYDPMSDKVPYKWDIKFK